MFFMINVGKMASLGRFCGHDLMDALFGLMDAVFGLMGIFNRQCTMNN